MPAATSGLIYIFTGDGKGKTSAALGIGLRASLIGKKVAMIQWYKDPSWKISEFNIPAKLPNFAIYPMGQGFYLKDKPSAPLATGQVVIDKKPKENHIQAAATALAKAQELISELDVLILDEINNAIADHLVKVEDIVTLLNRRGSTHVILTGRNAAPQLIDQADLVSSIQKIKHPYDRGKPAVRGLDF